MSEETMNGLVEDDLDALLREEDEAKRGGAKRADAAPAAEGAPAASPVEPWAARLKRVSELGGEGWLDGPAPAPTPALLRLPQSEGGGLYMPRGRVGLMIAPGGTGKSSLLIGLAVSVATGTPWLGAYPVEQDEQGEQNTRGRVLVIMAEEDEAELRRKLYFGARALSGLQRGLVGANVTVLPLQSVPCALLEDAKGAVGGRGEAQTSPFGRWLRALVEEAAREGAPYKLIILDPLSRFAGAADENDNGRATRLIQELEGLCSVDGAPTVLVAHHTNKGALSSARTDQGAARGASALVDGARWVVSLEPVIAPDGLYAGPDRGEGWGGSRLAVRLVKSNYGRRDIGRLELFWPTGGDGFVQPDAATVERWSIAAELFKAAGAANNPDAQTRANRNSNTAHKATSALEL